MTRRIALDGFAAMFAADADPWATFTSRDEGRKRAAILRGLVPGRSGRVLELAAGNGSNSVALAGRALRLDATEGTAEGTRLVARALAGQRRARAIRLALPARLPRRRYDAIVIAEVLYYLTPRATAAVARSAARALRPGGRLILAHHRIDFHDFTQHAATVQHRFLRDSGAGWRVRTVERNRRWVVVVAVRRAGLHPCARCGRSSSSTVASAASGTSNGSAISTQCASASDVPA